MTDREIQVNRYVSLSSRYTDSMDSLNSLPNSPSQSLLLVGPLDGIQCLHRVGKCKFLLVFISTAVPSMSCNITNGRCRWVPAASRLENARAHQLSLIIGYRGLTIKNVTNLARASRMTCRVQAWFWYNHAWTFTCYTIVFTGDHRAFELIHQIAI